ncbi:MAG: hypothetical protein ACM3UU_05730 [Ignavibacteriales bacterium]
MASYGIELEFNELIYFLFKRKKCPMCKQKLKRIKSVEQIGEGLDSVKLGQFYYGKKYEVTILYQCDNCKTVCPIAELAK